MSSFTDRSGKTYKLYEPFDHEGDFVLISENNVAFRVESYHLKAASPVFRSMLQTIDSDDQSAHIPDVRGRTLALCLKAITGQAFTSPRWIDADRAISWCKRCECFAVCRTILDAAVASLEDDCVFHAFTVAADLNEVSAGHRILLQGWKIEAFNCSNPKSHRHNPRPKSTTLRPRATWKLNMANRIPAPWLLALVRAEEKANSKHSISEHQSEKQYWVTLATAFPLD